MSTCQIMRTVADGSTELKQLRAALGLTQEGMAQRFKVFIRTYQRWESGESKVRARDLDTARAWVDETKTKASKKR